MSEYSEVSSRYSSNGSRYTAHYKRRSFNRQKRRKNKAKIFFIAIIFIVIVIILANAFSRNKNSDVLVGSWKYDQYTEYEFSNDATGCLCVDDVHYEYKYKISGDKLKIDFVKDVVRDCEYSFTVENKKLTLVGGKGTDKGAYKLSKIS